MTWIAVVALALVALTAAFVVFSPDPGRQAVTLSVYGLCLSLLFVALAAPDVALSELGINAAFLPLIVMLTIRKTRAPR